MKKIIKPETLSSSWNDREVEIDHNQRITELTKYIFQPIHEFIRYKNPEVATTMLTACQVDGQPHAVDLARYERMLGKFEEYPSARELLDALKNVADLLTKTANHATLLANLDASIKLINKELANLNEQVIVAIKNDILQLEQELAVHIKTNITDINAINIQLTALHDNILSITNSLQLHDEKNSEQDTRLDHLEANLGRVPLGYVYQQLPDTLSPQEIWPGTQWRLLTHLSGTFPRFEGGLASEFGSGTQDESLPNIQGELELRPYAYFSAGSDIAHNIFQNTEESKALRTKALSIAKSTGVKTIADGDILTDLEKEKRFNLLNFDASRSDVVYGRRAEVAPKNMTIRVWECIESDQEEVYNAQSQLINRVNQLEKMVMELQR